MNCRDSESLILAERDGALDKDRLAALSDHVAGCPACRKLRADLAGALEAYKADIAAVPVPDANGAWRELKDRLHSPARKRPLAPVIWFGATLAAAAALAFAFSLGRPAKSRSVPEVAQGTPPAPLYDPSVIAGADFVEAGDPNASTLVYVDKESGWLVVWATDAGTPASG